jgi:hypothetical protein
MSKKMKKITDYIDTKVEETVLVQCKVPKDLFDQVAEVKDDMGVSWRDIIVASFNRIVDESGKPKK